MSRSIPRVTVGLTTLLAAGVLLAGCGSSKPAAAPDPVASTTTSQSTTQVPDPTSTPAQSTTDSTPSSDSTSPSAPVSPTAVPASAPDVPGTCAALLKVDAVPQPDGGPDSEPSAADNKQFAKAVLPLLGEALSKADADLAKVLQPLRDDVAESADKGTALPEDTMVTVAAYEEWAHKNCGFQNVDVMAVDYKFDGLPAKLKAGPTSISMMNHSDKGEFHVGLITQLSDPKITTVKQLLATPLPDLMAMATLVGAVAAPPGASGGVLLDLKPGRYFVVCPVSVGGKEDSDDLHMMHGMAAVLEVG